MNRFKGLVLSVLTLLCLAGHTFAQSAEQATRAAQWDSYTLPDTAFTRFVDRKAGFSLWRPADWA